MYTKHIVYILENRKMSEIKKIKKEKKMTVKAMSG